MAPTVELDQLGAAWSQAYAGWAGALANFAVVGLTLWFATTETRKAKRARHLERQDALRYYAWGLRELHSAATEAVREFAAFTPELPIPEVRSDLRRRASIGQSQLAHATDSLLDGAVPQGYLHEVQELGSELYLILHQMTMTRRNIDIGQRLEVEQTLKDLRTRLGYFLTEMGDGGAR